MLLKVNPHKIEIVKEPVNEREINISKCQFEFAEEITEDYVKEAYFTLNSKTYKQIIINNQCDIPYEVLNKQGQIEIGVVAYLVENEEEIKRYNPSPVYISTLIGSLKDEFENSEPVTPSDKEQFEQMLQNGLNDINEAIDNAERLDINVSKTGTVATVSITRQDETTESVPILDGIDGEDGKDGSDGVGLDYNWQGTSLGIKREDEQGYEYVNLKGDTGPAGAIKMLIVNQLPTTGEEGTLYFVPKQDTETSDIYDEYMWVNNDWERLGEKQISIDLSDYYTKQETNNLLDDKADVEDIPDLTDYVKNTNYASSSTAGVIKSYADYNFNVSNVGIPYASVNNYSAYEIRSVNAFISKGTLENVIARKELVNKTYVDTLIGDISAVLDAINGEVI